MSAGEDDEDKEHEASQKKLDDARQRGEIARSQDLLTAAGYAGFLLAVLGLGGAAVSGAGTAGSVILARADSLAEAVFAGGTAAPAGAVAAMVGPVVPLVLLPGVAVLALLVAMRGLVFAPEKLAPKLSRISPLSGARQKFGREGLFAFAKSAVKLVVVGVILAWFLSRQADAILGTVYADPRIGMLVLARQLGLFMAIVVGIAAVMGGIDYLWQLAEHRRRNRMSRKELSDEMKDSEGDPHVKAHRRQRAQEIATNRMLADVAKADVVIVNPTHFAVALRWKRGSRSAPVCVAKGVDEIALRIRERAAEAGVPLHRDPPTARAIHATVEIGHEIRPEHYRAVAAAIRFAEAMRQKARRGWR